MKSDVTLYCTPSLFYISLPFTPMAIFFVSQQCEMYYDTAFKKNRRWQHVISSLESQLLLTIHVQMHSPEKHSRRERKTDT